MMQLIDMVTLAGAPKDEQPGRQREAGRAKKRSHKPGTVSAERRGAQERSQAVIPSAVEGPRCMSDDVPRGPSTALGMTERLGMKLKGIGAGLL
jgi:hypothetical protein